jgi:hypothetical protein
MTKLIPYKKSIHIDQTSTRRKEEKQEVILITRAGVVKVEGDAS